jgi:hypothetical protein
MGLLPATFQQLMRQVVDNFTSMGFNNSREGAGGVDIPLSDHVNTFEDILSGISS